VTIHRSLAQPTAIPAGTIGRNASASVIVCDRIAGDTGGRLVLRDQIGNECQFRSTNITFGDEATVVRSRKNSDTINVGSILGYKGFKDVTLTSAECRTRWSQR